MENKNIIKKNIFDIYFTNFFHFVKLLKINGLKQFIIILFQYYVGQESGWGQGAYLNFSTSAVSAGMMWMAGAGTARAGGASLSRETVSVSLLTSPKASRCDYLELSHCLHTEWSDFSNEGQCSKKKEVETAKSLKG